MNTESIYPAGMEEEKTLSSILSVRTVDAVPLQTATASLMKVYQTDGHDSATSISVVHDKLAIIVQRSECNNSAIQVSLSSANNCSLVDIEVKNIERRRLKKSIKPFHDQRIGAGHSQLHLIIFVSNSLGFIILLAKFII
ncbi:hypothetical protein KP509_32G005400 [Ceratopteris richardii]|uniref:Uncharacterized protein n=1 Tax=Ceratopteris richardii TaxID=49495 RepID=A0A8T2QSS5_CERRI|nr:hypothetical protein KP509_32G005400 [Ceratopteris richardii]